MISITECRQTLGPEAAQLSDADLASIRAQMYAVAECILTLYAKQTGSCPATNTTGVSNVSETPFSIFSGMVSDSLGQKSLCQKAGKNMS